MSQHNIFWGRQFLRRPRASKVSTATTLLCQRTSQELCQTLEPHCDGDQEFANQSAASAASSESGTSQIPLPPWQKFCQGNSLLGFFGVSVSFQPLMDKRERRVFLMKCYHKLGKWLPRQSFNFMLCFDGSLWNHCILWHVVRVAGAKYCKLRSRFLTFQTVWCKTYGFELHRLGGRTDREAHAGIIDSKARWEESTRRKHNSGPPSW